MSEVLVLAEHRGSEIREITFEMLGMGRRLAEKTGSRLSALLIGRDVERLAKGITPYCDTVYVIDGLGSEFFDPELCQSALSQLIRERGVKITMMGHTSTGLEIAPRLAVELDMPLVTDCIDFDFLDGRLVAFRQMFGGKLIARVTARRAAGYLVTLRQGATRAATPEYMGEVVKLSAPVRATPSKRRVTGYEVPAKTELDISLMDVLVAVGRGIGEKSNIALAEELANLLGGAVACSRPIVDKGWLPPDRQVGSSGKTVKPKLYLALGISGSFQHLMGMKDSQLIIAVNKDPGAPIFNVAHYGVVGDLLQIVPALIKRLREAKSGR